MTRTKLSGDIMDNYVQSTRAKDVGGGERLLQAASLPLHPQEQVSNTILIRAGLFDQFDYHHDRDQNEHVHLDV